MKRTSKDSTPIRFICAALFSAFSFLYIYMFQGELLALVQDHLAQGKTSNNALITAILVTALLAALQYQLNKLGRLAGRFEAWSYLPSCALIALITRVDMSTYSYSLWMWIMGVVLVALLYIGVVWVERNSLHKHKASFVDELTPNLAVMTVLFVLTGSFGSDLPADKMELAAWKYVHDNRYDKVLGVGRQSYDTNADLTALRNLAFAQTGRWSEEMFSVPQPYGSSGLLMSNDGPQAPSYGATRFYDALGQHPEVGEGAVEFYRRIAEQTDTAIYRNLYIASLLLDKDLDTFATLTAGNSSLAETLDKAPKHYQEAWMIYNEQNPFTPITFNPDKKIAQCYQDYMALYEEMCGKPTELENLCRRKFGDTYWFYYDFIK